MKNCFCKFLFLLIINLVFYTSSQAQNCGISGSVNISDNDTTFISLVIDNLVNDDLSSPTQGICAVVLSFEHEAIGDLEISLISPGGQSVLLMGPGVANSQPTSLNSWNNIAFVPCSGTPNPAAGTSAQWNNLDNWGFLFNYSNLAYFPNQGCLEDINTGSANGIWTLQIVDGAFFDDGVILDFEIFFCDSNGLDCNDCQADGGVLPIGDVIACQGSPELLNNIPAVYPSGTAPDAIYYDYRYVVYNNNEITAFFDQSDFTSLASGQYTVCGMSFLKDQLAQFPTVGITVDSFENILSINSFCGDLSDNCFELNINARPDTIFINEVICLGDSLPFRGNFYNIEGSYNFLDSVDLCEQITQLNLEVRQVQAVIDANIPLLSCDQEMITLNALASITGGNGNFTWSTTTGNIVSNNLGDSIVVNAVGSYTLTLEEDGCVSTDMIFVGADDSVPNAQFIFNEINCNFDSSFIDATFNRPIVSYKWIFEGDSIANTEDIAAAQVGIYMLEVIADNGCEAMYTIQIEESFETASPDLSAMDIDCNNPTVRLQVENTSGGNHQWYFNNLLISNQVRPTVSNPGDYELVITESNGCADTFNLTVGIDTISPETNLVVPQITCTSPQVEVTASSPTPTIFIFSGIGIVSQDSSSALIDQPGLFNVIAIGQNGCVNDTSFTVIPDVNFPVYDAQDGFIDCGQDSVLIVNNVNSNGINFSWTGPGSFTSSDPEPYAFVAGTYFVVGETGNGCAVFDTIEIELNPSIPVLSFARDTLDCNQDMVTITPSQTNDLLFDWAGPSFTASTPVITVDEAAVYRVTVTDINDSNCTARFSVRVVGDFQEPEYTVTHDVFGCMTDSLVIDLQVNSPIDSMVWTNPGFLSHQEDLTVYNTGQYIIELFGSNGCITKDTIEIGSDLNEPAISIDNIEINCLNFSPNLTTSTTDSIDTYLWTSPQNNFSSADPSPMISAEGMYFLEATAPNGCSTIDSILVATDTIAPIVTVMGVTSISCEDPNTTLTLESNDPQASYSWVDLDGTLIQGNLIIVNQQGFYTYSVSSLNNCTRVDSVFVENISIEEFAQLNATEINCYSAESKVSLSGISLGTTIRWESPNGTLNNTEEYTTQEEGFHYLELTSTAGCITEDSIEVIVNLEEPVLPEYLNDTLTCNDPLFTIDLALNFSFDSIIWLKDGQFFDDNMVTEITEAGNYQYTVWATNGCTDMESVSFEIDTLKPTAVLTGGSVSCNESKLLLEADLSTDVVFFQWSGPNGFLSDEIEPTVKDPGEYTILLMAENGCTDSVKVEVINDLIPPDVEQVDQYLPCENFPITLSVPNVSPGSQVSWIGPNNFFSDSPTPSVNVPGQYFVFATGVNGCIARDTFMVLDIPVPPVFSAENLTLDCNNLSQNLISTDTDDDMLVEWFDDQNNLLNGATPVVSDAGNYSLVVTGQNYCKDTLLVTVGVDTISPVAVIDNDGFLICTQTSYDITAINSMPVGNVSYSWSTADGDIIGANNISAVEVASVGEYQVLVTNFQNGCTDTAITQVENGVEIPIAYELDPISPSCIGDNDGMIQVFNVEGGYPPYTYSVANGGSQSDSLLANLTAGVYTVYVYDRFGCQSESQAIIQDGTDLLLNLGDDLSIYLGDTVDITAQLNVDISFLDTTIWSSFVLDSICDFCLNPTIVPLQSGLYSLTTVDINGCKVTDEIYITVDERRDVYVPNIFSPNGDNVNDRLIIGASDGVAIINEFKIFDNWGNKVYQLASFLPENEMISWDGSFKGKDLNPAVFVYMIDFTLINGERIFEEGSITLIR